MKKILNLFNYYKVESFIEIFELSGLVKTKRDLVLEKMEYISWGLFLIFSFTYIVNLLILISISNMESLYAKIFTIGIVILGLSMSYPLFTLKNKIRRSFKKITKKHFKLLIKDDNFKEFINEYYYDIKNKNLTKKETISFVNNWESNKIILDTERKEKEIERLTTLISSEEEENLKSKERIKEAKEKLKDLK